MELHITDAQSLAIIDQEIECYPWSPAEYEIVRRVVYATADFDYQQCLSFSERVLPSGAAALASRTTIIVDVPMVQVGIVPKLQPTFANPVYCSAQTITRPQKDKTQAASGLETLASRYPEGIFIIGESLPALTALVDLVQKQRIRPALVIATPINFIAGDDAKVVLQQANIPSITVTGRKGSPVVAVAILNGLVDLAWQAFEQSTQTVG